ncbi:basic proline-rich protein-like [Prinia subflava]|uniref:basic proline-rich protein-like n=1 Tax=Prinia subflava TaxID=208062 RepID=UPI002FE3AE71
MAKEGADAAHCPPGPPGGTSALGAQRTSLRTRLQTQHPQRAPLLQERLPALPAGLSAPPVGQRRGIPGPAQGREKRSWENAFPSLEGLSASHRLRGGRARYRGSCERGRKRFCVPSSHPRDSPSAPPFPVPWPRPGPPGTRRGLRAGAGAPPIGRAPPVCRPPVGRAAAGPAPPLLSHWPPSLAGPRPGPASPGSFKFMEENK